jgi:peptidoglycan/xylan/chitin deacetylase (PgdA/CDA1 family)
MSLGLRLLRVTARAGLLNAVAGVSGPRLTVLAYHRIADVSDPGFDTYVSNVSASPRAFRAQLDHVARHFDVIGLAWLMAWLEGSLDLPRRPLLLTFDDGYRDNFENALPALRERGLPAVLFVTTGFVDSGRPLYWDRLARGFHRTRRSSLSAAGRELRWERPAERAAALNEVIARLKELPEDEKQAAVDAILESLGEPGEARSPLLAMDWSQVRELARHGIAIGGHTHTHPILSRLPLGRAEAEIRICLERIESELGQPARSFAYTNGGPADFGPEHERFLSQLGVRAAFSLVPGPARWAEARARPLAIRRVAVHRHDDDLARFEVKLAGGARLAHGLRRG